MAYNVLEVCRHIINYSNDKNYEISNLKLQKILYFVQGCFLVDKDVPCFNEKIEAWDFGPVVPEAYREYKIYGATNIPRITRYLSFINGTSFGIRFVDYKDNVIEDDDKTMIEEVVDSLSGISALGLVDYTHQQDPWKNAYSKGKNTEITLESIKECFKQYEN